MDLIHRFNCMKQGAFDAIERNPDSYIDDYRYKAALECACNNIEQRIQSGNITQIKQMRNEFDAELERQKAVYKKLPAPAGSDWARY